jgi:hypothetical protein
MLHELARYPGDLCHQPAVSPSPIVRRTVTLVIFATRKSSLSAAAIIRISSFDSHITFMSAPYALPGAHE